MVHFAGKCLVEKMFSKNAWYKKFVNKLKTHQFNHGTGEAAVDWMINESALRQSANGGALYKRVCCTTSPAKGDKRKRENKNHNKEKCHTGTVNQQQHKVTCDIIRSIGKCGTSSWQCLFSVSWFVLSNRLVATAEAELSLVLPPLCQSKTHLPF